MKHLSLLLFILLLLSCGTDRHPGRSSLYSEPREIEPDEYKDMNDQPVYICTGPKSHAYHYDSDCYGLTNCSGDIETVSIDEAEEIGRHPCHYCAP